MRRLFGRSDPSLKPATLRDIDFLQRQVTELEERVLTLTKAVTYHQSALDAMTARIGRLESAVAEVAFAPR